MVDDAELIELVELEVRELLLDKYRLRRATTPRSSCGSAVEARWNGDQSEIGEAKL